MQILGFDPANRSTSRQLRERLGVVLQELAVEPFLSVRRVLARNAGYYPNPRPVDEVIELVGLSEKANAKVKSLSGGQQRRLDLGLGIIGNPELLFFDEPTTGFDPSARRDAWDVVRALTGGGTTIILTTHYMDEAESLADRVAVISGGQIIAAGTPESLGGRDVGEAHIRFRLPPGTTPPDLRVAVATVPGDGYEITTSEEIEVLGALTRWAIDSGVAHHRAHRGAHDPGRRLPAPHRLRERRHLDVARGSAMSAGGTRTGTFRGVRDLKLVARQVYYEQLSFWLNPIGSAFTLLFSVVFLVLLGSTAGNSRISHLGNIRAVVYYVPGFAAYGLMAACFNLLAIQLVTRREMGLLKRLRLSPLPTWTMLGGVIGSALIVTLVQVVALLLIGRIGYDVAFPHNLLAFVVTLAIGGLCFTSLGVAASTVVPNQDSAGPDVEHRVLRAAVPVGAVVPDQEGLGTGALLRLLPGAPLDRSDRRRHLCARISRVAVDRPQGDGPLGGGRHHRGVTPVALGAAPGLKTRWVTVAPLAWPGVPTRS